jgi:hypothetical protein
MFSGYGCLSVGIQLGTFSKWSHIGASAFVDAEMIKSAKLSTLVDSERYELLESHLFRKPRWLCFESTTFVAQPCAITGQRAFHGVQAHDVSARIRSYKGEVGRLRLKAPLSPEEAQAFTLALLAYIGTPYDGKDVWKAGTRLLKRSRLLFPADRSSLFCSEYVADCLNQVRLLKTANPGRWSPAEIYRWAMSTGYYDFETIFNSRSEQ